MSNSSTRFTSHISSNGRYYFLALLFIALSLTDRSLGMRGIKQIETSDINLICPESKVREPEISSNDFGLVNVVDQFSTIRGGNYRISFNLRVEVKDEVIKPPTDTQITLLLMGHSTSREIATAKVNADNQLRYYEYVFLADHFYSGYQLLSESSEVNIYISSVKLDQITSLTVRPTIIGSVDSGQVEPLEVNRFVRLSPHRLTLSEFPENGLVKGVAVKLRKIGNGGMGKYRVGIWTLDNGSIPKQRLSTIEFTSDEMDNFRDKHTGNYIFPIVAKLEQPNEYALVIDATAVRVNYWNKLLIGVGSDQASNSKLRGYQPGVKYSVIKHTINKDALVSGAVAKDYGNIGHFSYVMNDSHAEVLSVLNSGLSRGDIGYSQKNHALLLGADGETEAVYRFSTEYNWTDMQIVIDQGCKRSVPIKASYSHDGIRWSEIAPTISERNIGSGNDLVPVIDTKIKAPASSKVIFIKIIPSHQLLEGNGTSSTYSAITGLRLQGRLTP